MLVLLPASKSAFIKSMVLDFVDFAALSAVSLYKPLIMISYVILSPVKIIAIMSQKWYGKAQKHEDHKM